MHTKPLRRVALALLACAPLLVMAAPYKWVDEHGVTHYTQLPPSGKSAQEVNVPKPRAPAPPTASAPAASGTGPADASGKSPAADADETARIRQENCRRAQENLSVLETNRRIRVKDGETYRVIGEDERLQNIERQRQMIKDYCDPE